MEINLINVNITNDFLKLYSPVLPLSSPSHQFASDVSIRVIISPVLKVSSLSSAASKS